MKKSIYIAIIVIALGGAALMGYMAFSGGGSSGGEGIVIESSAQVYNILPNGKDLDFDTLKSYNDQNLFFPYPQVTPSEVGQVLGNIIE